MNSVGVSELNIIFDVFILVWRKKMILFRKCFCFDIQIGLGKSDETGNKKKRYAWKFLTGNFS